ncbi:MAG: GNAT family N-acetyltransferase [Rickettsiales bacterium]|nr:GNAT family N-acetyltransferase [Rickettsiales bacterium]
MNKVEYTANPAVSDIDFITEKINKETTEYGEAYPFAFFIRDAKSNIIAGANGYVMYGEIYTDQLWVDKSYRRIGVGKKLMDAIHQYGKKEGCHLATVQTMSFQNAKDFYERCGYVVELERFGYNNKSSCFLLKREL